MMAIDLLSRRTITVVMTVVMTLSIFSLAAPSILAQSGFEYTGASSGLPTEGDYSYIATGDFNKDGKLDVVSSTASYQSDGTFGLYVWTGDGSGSWSKKSQGLPTTENFGGIGVGDLNKDGNLDIVAGYEPWSGSSKGVGVWLGNGGSGGLKFSEGTQPIDTGGYDSAELADVDQDGKLDILGGSKGSGIKIWLGDGGTTWTEKNDGLPTSGEFTMVTAGDVDGDGDLDIAAGNYNGNGVQVWLRESDGSWTEASEGLWDRDNSFGLKFKDMDKDGDLDLVGAVRGRGVFVWTGNGGTGGTVKWTESKEGLPTSGKYKQLDVADIDGDDKLDIVVSSPDGGIHVYKGNGGAGGSLSFTDVSGDLPTSGKYYGAAFGKVNGDQVLDVIAATWGEGVKAWTVKLGPEDNAPPSAITDLKANAVDHKSVKLTWSAPGDDGTSGTATKYDIRYSSTGIKDMTDFDAAFKVENEPSPKAAGSSESFTVPGLSAKKTYYFTIVSYDEALNPSKLSNEATATTPEASTTTNPPTVDLEDPQVGSVLKGTVTITMTFSDPDNDVNELEIYVDGNKVESMTGMTSPQTWDWNTKKGDNKVKNGDHTIKVVVTDSAGTTASDEVTFEVKNKKEDTSGTPGFEAIVLVLAVMVGLMVFGRDRKAN